MDIWKWLIMLTLSPVSEGCLCTCTYSRRPWSNVAKDIRVHYMYIDVIKWSIQVHCQSKDKAVNQRHRVALLVTDIVSGSIIKIPMFDMYVFYVITIIEREHFSLFFFLKYLLYILFIYLLMYLYNDSINHNYSVSIPLYLKVQSIL